MDVHRPQRAGGFHETCFDVGNVSFTFLAATYIDQSVRREWETLNLVAHTHLFYEIFIVLDGRLTIELQNTAVELAPLQALLIPPGCLHRLRENTPDIAVCSVSFSFQKKRADSPADLYADFRTLFSRAPHLLEKSAELAGTMSRLIAYQESNRIEKWRLMSACFNEMIFLCKELLERRILKSNSAAGYSSREFRDYMIDDYLNTYFTDDITLESLAEIFYLTPQHINRIIRRNYGLPFRQHIIQLRVRYAKMLLTETSYRINQIAAMCGYDSQHGFYVVFEKAVGCTPDQYRKRYVRNVVK